MIDKQKTLKNICLWMDDKELVQCAANALAKMDLSQRIVIETWAEKLSQVFATDVRNIFSSQRDALVAVMLITVWLLFNYPNDLEEIVNESEWRKLK